MEKDGSLSDYGKKEQSASTGGFRMFRNLVRFATLDVTCSIFTDLKREHNAVAEARKLKIPIVAIVDTNCDPTLVSHPIPGNDDSIRSIRLILSAIAERLQNSRPKPIETSSEADATDNSGEAEVTPVAPPVEAAPVEAAPCT